MMDNWDMSVVVLKGGGWICDGVEKHKNAFLLYSLGRTHTSDYVGAQFNGLRLVEVRSETGWVKLRG